VPQRVVEGKQAPAPFPAAAARLYNRAARITIAGVQVRLLASSVFAAGLLTFAPAATARELTLNVTFSATGSLTVTLPDGTPVGTASGAPTVIPAGYYAVVLSGPGGCAYLPLFDLRGPGVSILSDMVGGEVDTYVYNEYFMPSSTFTWRNDRNPGVAFTFVTSNAIVGTAPTPTTHGITGKSTTVSSQDLVGSASAPFRGTLTGAVSAAGRLTIAHNGRSVNRLRAGRYTFSVTDRSSTSGFLLAKSKRVFEITGSTFVGKHSTTVILTAGRWLAMPAAGKTAYAIVVS
jgi:hypothetical protein